MTPQPKHEEQQSPANVVTLQEVHTGTQCRVEGNIMHVAIPMGAPVPSSTGHMSIVASTHGFKPTGIVVDGKPAMLNLTLAI